jgi:hypothetical protein
LTKALTRNLHPIGEIARSAVSHTTTESRFAARVMPV